MTAIGWVVTVERIENNRLCRSVRASCEPTAHGKRSADLVAGNLRAMHPDWVVAVRLQMSSHDVERHHSTLVTR